MEDARRKAGVDAFMMEQLEEVFLFARAAAGDDGDIHPGRHGVQHLEVEAVPDTVSVDAVETHFACAVVHAPFDPFQRVPASVFAPALGKDAELAVHPLDVG